MKTAAFVILFLVGIIEIAFGVFLGRLRIYAIESPFWRALGLSAEQSKVFLHYIDLLKDQWQIVAWFGVITVFAASLLFWSLQRER